MKFLWQFGKIRAEICASCPVSKFILWDTGWHLAFRLLFSFCSWLRWNLCTSDVGSVTQQPPHPAITKHLSFHFKNPVENYVTKTNYEQFFIENWNKMRKFQLHNGPSKFNSTYLWMCYDPIFICDFKQFFFLLWRISSLEHGMELMLHIICNFLISGCFTFQAQYNIFT